MTPHAETIAAVILAAVSGAILAGWSLGHLARWVDRHANARVDRMVREWVLDEAAEEWRLFPDDDFIDSLRADIAVAERAEFERAVLADIDQLTRESA